jgi:hypothetical protein
MAAPKKNYQYVLTEEECKLFNLLRQCEDDIMEPFALGNEPGL